MFLDGGEKCIPLSPHPCVSTVVSLAFPFHYRLHLLIFISARPATRRSQSSIAKYNTETCLTSEVVHCGFQTQTHQFITAIHQEAIKVRNGCRIWFEVLELGQKKSNFGKSKKKASTLAWFANHNLCKLVFTLQSWKMIILTLAECEF